tara:strand:- start:581 stop:1357 length:777 start_codon:yes stop_codon:yes gene_type:complete
MEVLKTVQWTSIIYSILLMGIGFIIAKRLSQLVERSMSHRFSRHQALLARRLIFYVLFFTFLVSALHQIGFKITVLLGAAGVFTVALSFASQTAASNLVSGIFLIFESPFKVGDTITVKNITGVVDSIDLLSTIIISVDNKKIRVPNETIVKSEITNMSSKPIRRIDLILGISYDSNIDEVKQVLMDIADKNPDVLGDPAPNVIINQFADSAIEIKFMAWVASLQYGSVKNQLNHAIKAEVDKGHIQMPFPQLTLHKA